MKLDFVTAAKTGQWKVAGASLTGDCEGVAFTGERRWWGGQWSITGRAELGVPEKVLLFISEKGMDHGFWRDMTVGDRDFDRRHFVFCDTPGLLRLVVGRQVIRAISDTNGNAPITVYARGGMLETRATNHERDANAIARHVAIHRAFAADHAALVSRWQDCLASASGRGASTWPLTGQISSRVGTLLVNVTWEMRPESRDGAEWESGYRSLRTEISAFGDRTQRRWLLAEVGPGTRATHEIGERRYALSGTAAIDPIASLIEEADLVQLSFGAKLVLSLHGLANERRLGAAVRIADQLLRAQSGSTSPYR